jgi:hypothetical protein
VRVEEVALALKVHAELAAATAEGHKCGLAPDIKYEFLTLK